MQTKLKMKSVIIVLLILGAVMLTEAFVYRPSGPSRSSNANFPTFPGQGPFNPRPRWPDAYGRGRRSVAYADDEYPLHERQARASESDSWSAFE